MTQKSYLPRNLKLDCASVWVAVMLVLTTLLLPGQAATAFAQGVHPACKNDAGTAVIPSAGAGIGAWMLVLNFNHSPSTTTTTGCLIKTIALGPQKVSRTLVNCLIMNNQGSTQVGSGSAPFDGKFSVNCPGITAGKRKLENFTVWGQANFGSNNADYSILQHTNVTFTAEIDVDWHIDFSSQYGSNIFDSGNRTFNLLGQTVSFMSALRAGVGSHSLNSVDLGPLNSVPAFEFNYDQPFVIGAAGQVWTLHELIIDPPGGCCKAG